MREQPVRVKSVDLLGLDEMSNCGRPLEHFNFNLVTRACTETPSQTSMQERRYLRLRVSTFHRSAVR
jgi:hypothetical protein